jgi:hypothetical protein
MKKYIGTIVTGGAMLALAYHIASPPRHQISNPLPDYADNAGGAVGENSPPDGSTNPSGSPSPSPSDLPPGDNSTNGDSSIDNYQKLFGDQPSTGRTDNGLNLSTYGYSNDPYLDSNSAMGKGAWENRLTPQAVALSPDIAAANNLHGGEAVYINGNFVGYYEDKTDPSITNTVDFYDPNHQVGSDLKTSNGKISFGPGRPLTPYSS